jgi:hypothetical protein
MRNIFLLRKISAQGLWIACFGIVLVRCTAKVGRNEKNNSCGDIGCRVVWRCS